MKDGAPQLIAIDHDDYHAEHIGKTPDGRQFILTTPFVPAIGGNEGAEFVALYLFDSQGKLLDARIENFGSRKNFDQQKHEQQQSLYESWLKQLGEVSYERIEVAPFSIERHGTTFGLVTRVPVDDEDVWAVEMQPGNYMAFFEPWDSGEYDT